MWDANILVLIDRGKRRDEIETSPMTALPSTHAASIRRPWSSGARARGIGAEICADLRAELVSLERLPALNGLQAMRIAVASDAAAVIMEPSPAWGVS
jgi:hypothetical protein